MTALRQDQPLFLANNLALDFINTRFGSGDEFHDFLTDDISVISWLKSAGQLSEQFADIPAGLVGQARALRKTAFQMVDACRAGNCCSPEQLNQLLNKGRPLRKLEWDSQLSGFRLVEYRKDNSTDSLLEPVATALALLLTSDELKYVRQCEAHDCTLMFLDMTKSHRRRWCSMTLCGNRTKVTAFRSRKRKAE